MQNKYDTNVTLADNTSLTYILKQIKPGSTVLEFGPATGYMTRYLKEELQCHVYIVEIDADAYEKARAYAEDGVCGSAEENKWYEKFKHIRFDYITFADVLEHLVNPWEMLRRVSGLLKENTGQILVSIPNIAHNAVLVDLFNNKFEYRRTGIMDNTHLRFFTHDSVVEMFRQCGLHVINEDAVVFELKYAGFGNSEGDVPENVWRELQLRKYGFVNQFLFTLGQDATSETHVTKHDSVILENALYYTTDDAYVETQKVIGKVALNANHFETEFIFEEAVEAKQLMVDLFRFSGKITELELKVNEEAAQSYINCEKDETGAYCFYHSVKLEVDFGEKRSVKRVCVSGVIAPIQLSTMEQYVAMLEKNCNEASEGKAQEIGRLNQVVEEKLDIINQLGNTLQEKEQQLMQQEEQLHELMAMVDAKEHQLQEQAAAIDAKEHQLQEQAAVIDAKEHQLQKQAAVIDAKEQKMQEHISLLGEKDKFIDEIKNTSWYKLFGKRMKKEN